MFARTTPDTYSHIMSPSANLTPCKIGCLRIYFRKKLKLKNRPTAVHDETFKIFFHDIVAKDSTIRHIYA